MIGFEGVGARDGIADGEQASDGGVLAGAFGVGGGALVEAQNQRFAGRDGRVHLRRRLERELEDRGFPSAGKNAQTRDRCAKVPGQALPHVVNVEHWKKRGRKIRADRSVIHAQKSRNRTTRVSGEAGGREKLNKSGTPPGPPPPLAGVSPLPLPPGLPPKKKTSPPPRGRGGNERSGYQAMQKMLLRSGVRRRFGRRPGHHLECLVGQRLAVLLVTPLRD